MEYFSAFKKKEILSHGTIWMNLEEIMLSEIRITKGQVLYDSTYRRCNSWKRKVEWCLTEARTEWGVA